MAGLCPAVMAQTLVPDAADSSVQPPPALIETYSGEQRSLSFDVSSLHNQGRSASQIGHWADTNAPLFQLQMQRAQLIAAYADFQPCEFVTQISLPEDGSNTLENFLAAKATLFNRLVQIHNQLAPTWGQTISVFNAAAFHQNVDNLFQQQNAAEVETQNARMADLATDSAHQPLPEPAPVIVPDDASPQLKAYLLARYQLMQAEVAVHNQYCSGDLSLLNAAVDQWEQQHAAQFSQLNQLALALAQSTQNQ